MTTVNFFNANIASMNVTVNRGRDFTVAAVDTTTWVPGTIASGGPGWDNGGPSTNNLGPGDNLLQVKLGTSAITSATVTLPPAAVLAVQVYFMFPQVGNASNVSWSALYQGQLVASGTSGMQTFAEDSEGGSGGGGAQVEPE